MVRKANAELPLAPAPGIAADTLLEALWSSIADAVVMVDAGARVTALNPAAERLTGWLADDVVGRPLEAVVVVAAEDAASVSAWSDWVRAIGAREPGTLREAWLTRNDGQRVAVEGFGKPLLDGDGELQGGVVVLRDLSAVRQLSGQIFHQATHDSLTGLINRQEFERLLFECLGRPTRRQAGHALLYLDLDQFKVVNDTCGHAAGDQLLRQVADVLNATIRQADVLGRLGGDEFGVLLRDCALGPALRVADKLRQSIADFRFACSGRSFALGISIGLVHFDADASAPQVLSAADASCFIAKDKGRNRVYVHDRSDEETTRRSGELDWASRIDGALTENRFVLYGQRIAAVDARPGNGHYEILVRMRDENGALVPPNAFLPAAERYGLMPAIDRWVVRHAFTTLARARADGATRLRLSINLSAASLNDDAFLPFLQGQFAEHGIPHAQIGFEITETAAIANLASAARVIDALRRLGCTFSLDDFGSGMSSFGYLKHLRIDFLKIDGAFVRNLAHDRIDAAMVEAIQRVGQVMGLQTIAEFVEDDAILQRLRELGVDFAQGYGIHAPQPLAFILERYVGVTAPIH
jgi:diguanylate cyclase (GGDEF)-like protein/PAS domain S-box-containing protein